MFGIKATFPTILTEEQMTALGSGFEDYAQAYVALKNNKPPGSPWEVEFVTETKPDIDDLNQRLQFGIDLFDIQELKNFKAEWMIEEIPETDWLAESYRQFPPFEITPFYIHGSHYEGEIPQGLLKLQIDAATAFGSGEHGTTKGCIQAMVKLKDDGACPWNVLDMGTGSGILAIAAWKLWKTPILAVDNEEESVVVSIRHQKANGVPEVASAMSCVCGDGYKTPQVQTKKPYDLIIANILAAPLIEMAPECKAVADENGYVILSGMLNDQADDVQKAYENQGMILRDKIIIGEWSTLVLQNSAA